MTPTPSEEQVEAARALLCRIGEHTTSAYTVPLEARIATLLAEREAAAYRRGQERMRERAEQAIGDAGGDNVEYHENAVKILRIEDPQ